MYVFVRFYVYYASRSTTLDMDIVCIVHTAYSISYWWNIAFRGHVKSSRSPQLEGALTWHKYILFTLTLLHQLPLLCPFEVVFSYCMSNFYDKSFYEGSANRVCIFCPHCAYLRIHKCWFQYKSYLLISVTDGASRHKDGSSLASTFIWYDPAVKE